MLKLAIITVPYITNETHLNMMVATYNSLDKIEDSIKIAVVNHLVDINYIKVVDRYNNVRLENGLNCLAKAWNLGIKKAIELGFDYFYLPNLDIQLQKGALQRLFDFAKSNPEASVWASTVTNIPSDIYIKIPDDGVANIINHDQAFSSFMISKKTIDQVGYFDEQFEPCYFEDDDYIRRCRLLGKEMMITRSSLFYHYVQGTVRNDKDEMLKFNKHFYENQKRYIDKWGGVGGQELFNKPYNE